jgi:hypothetical protein
VQLVQLVQMEQTVLQVQLDQQVKDLQVLPGLAEPELLVPQY